jgi:TolB protein
VREFNLAQPPLAPEWRLSLHQVADEMEQWITGVRGIAATRILYESRNRIWQVDADGANPEALTNGSSAIVVSPVWHPKATHIAYAALNNGRWQIVIREEGGATRVLPTTPGGLNTTPVFSPDGSTIVYGHAEESGTDLYATNAFASEPARRITVGRGSSNTAPTFSPDGRRIAFTSDRNGHPEVYISDADGTNADLLTLGNVGESYRSEPDWSPDGRMIAFVSQIAGKFQIMTIGLRDRAVKRYTSEGVNEQPSWAPDSRHLVFTSNRGGSKQLWVVDIESGTFRQLTHAPGSARLGAWSPPLRPR